MFLPAVGGQLTVALPGEYVRATVARVVSKHRVLIELTFQPLNPAKSHIYRIGDIVCCDRVEGELGEEWKAVDERRLQVSDKPHEAAEKRRKTTKKARAKRVTKKRRTIKRRGNA